MSIFLNQVLLKIFKYHSKDLGIRTHSIDNFFFNISSSVNHILLLKSWYKSSDMLDVRIFSVINK